jgi:heme exporter protein B
MNTSLLASLGSVIEQALRMRIRQPQHTLQPLLFFTLVIALFPLAISPDPARLATLAPGVIWVAALLATLLSLNQLFHADFHDGGLEQWLLTPCPLVLLVMARVGMHWALVVIPLLLITPLLGMMLALPLPTILMTMLTLFIGTPTLIFCGAMLAALTVAVRSGTILLGLLLLPLYVPVLIFGANAILLAASGASTLGAFSVLGALLCLALTLTPFVTAHALRLSINQ